MTSRIVQSSTFWSALPFTVVLLAASGCGSHQKAEKKPQAGDVALQRDELALIDDWAVEAPMDHSIDNAVIRQRVLYDYHFVDGQPHLTVVGRRDVITLARHYRGSSWVLNLKPGDADPELYQARIRSVMDLMARQGVVDSELVITDGSPGGIGMPSSDARRIRAESIQGAGSLDKGDPYQNDSGMIQPLDTPLEGGS